MDIKKDTGFATKAIHGNYKIDDPYKALNVPIYQSSTYYFDTCEDGGQCFAGNKEGYIYTRLGNPTTKVLEQRVALLEDSEDCAAFSSGMGAISSVFWSFNRAGSHIVADTTLYGCTFAMLEHGATRFGIEVEFVDMSDIAGLKSALKSNTTMVYFETPANPNMKIIDIEAVSKAVKEYSGDIRIVCDNTFATPYLQRPITLGCDIVVHSATKYLNGHGDVIAGFACGRGNDISVIKLFGLKDMTGAVISPNDAYLILRGLKTLEIRMDRHCLNAEKLVEYLVKHPKVIKVYYPGLKSHPGYEIAKKQMSHPGGMIAIEVDGGLALAEKFVNSLSLCVVAVSLGDAETLVEHPASMTHSTYTKEELKLANIPEGLVRISAGLENIEDILADFDQAFSAI